MVAEKGSRGAKDAGDSAAEAVSYYNRDSEEEKDG
jgi:hypothetical protein